MGGRDIAGPCASSSSPLPGGIGVVDAAMILMLTNCGTAAVPAAAGVLAGRSITFAVIAALSWMLWAAEPSFEQCRPTYASPPGRAARPPDATDSAIVPMRFVDDRRGWKPLPQFRLVGILSECRSPQWCIVSCRSLPSATFRYWRGLLADLYSLVWANSPLMRTPSRLGRSTSEELWGTPTRSGTSGESPATRGARRPATS
ncbi:MAG: hypothetical protein QOD10_1634 [Mycobacterium sp.]|nr:hypothetical protein [Mycobacterium sp.]